MSFRMRKGRASFNVGRRGPRASYRMRRATPLLVLALGAIVAACGPAAPASSVAATSSPSPSVDPTPSPSPTPEPTPASHAMTVSLDLTDPGAWPDGTLTCAGTGGYDDIFEASQVVVRDESGTVLATADLGIGLLLQPDTCSFITKVENIPPAAFYTVEISHRGELIYSAAEMEQKGWRVAVTLGSAD
jgi:hypothetical protein